MMLKPIFLFMFHVMLLMSFSFVCVANDITLVCANDECIMVDSDLLRLSGPINQKLGDRFADLQETTVHLPLCSADIILKLMGLLTIATKEYSPTGKTLAGSFLTKEHMFFKEQSLLASTFKKAKSSESLTLKECVLLLNTASLLELPVVENICLIRFLEQYTSELNSKKFKISGKKILADKFDNAVLERVTMKFLSYERTAKKKLKKANLSLIEQLILAKTIEKNNLSYLFVPIHTLIVETVKQSEEEILDDINLNKLVTDLRNLKSDFFDLKTFDLNLSQHHTTLAVLGEMLKRNFNSDTFVKLFKLSNSFNLPYLETAVKLHLERLEVYHNQKFKKIWKELPQKLKTSYKSLGYDKTKPDFISSQYINKTTKRCTFS